MPGKNLQIHECRECERSVYLKRYLTGHHVEDFERVDQNEAGRRYRPRLANPRAVCPEVVLQVT